MEVAEKPAIAVVIVLYNGMRWIQKCFDSVFASNIPVSIYLVDNASTDDTVQWIEQHYGNRVKLHLGQKNLGFGRANNIALKQAWLDGFEHFFLLNQDCYVFSTTIQLLYHTHKANPGYGVISPFHLNGTGSQPDPGFEGFINRNATPGLLEDWAGDRLSEDLYPSKFINAAAWMISRNCLETIGLFNPAFFHYGEDVNYVHRVQYHQFAVGVYAKSRVCHDKEYGDAIKGKKQKRYDQKVYFLFELSNPKRYAGYTKLLAEHLYKMIMAFLKGDASRRKSLTEKVGVLFSMNPFEIARCRNQSMVKGTRFFDETESFKNHF